MGFGESVNKLLETYTSCIKLLRSFKKHHSSNSDDASSILRSSIRSDRSQIRRAFSSRLSENGKRLEKGDRRSRGLIRKTLKRLNAAMSGLLSSNKGQQPFLDYESLQRLSNSSRLDAINTIDQLSQRLGNSASRNSLVSAVSGGDRRHYSTRSDERKRGLSRHAQQMSTRNSVGSRGADHPTSPSRSRVGTKERRSPNRRHSAVSTAGMPERLSAMSGSTDSTKLGEIPERRWLRGQNANSNDSDSSGCYPVHVRPTYPLKAYPSPEPRSRTIWRLFGRR